MELIIKGKSQEDFLQMQKIYYDNDGRQWSQEHPDPVVGNWNAHLKYPYEEYLFKGIEGLDKMDVLEYGCGPGRNIVRFSPLVKTISGTDISHECITQATNYTQAKNIPNVWHLIHCDGKSIPEDFWPDNSVDLVFSVICLQHICAWSVRQSIFKEINRVLKKDGIFTAQMGFGGRPNAIGYYDDYFDASSTNGSFDVSVMNVMDLAADLDEANFYDFKYELRETCADVHAQWIFFQGKKK